MHSLQKEPYFLNYNKVNIATDLIQSEFHLDNLKPGLIQGGHANCVVKHTLDAAGECKEATSHALIVEGEEKSQKFKALGDDIHSFREKLMGKKLTRSDAIRGIRKLKRKFESFNPEFDVSKCESCGSIDEILRQVKVLSEPMKEKVLNSHPSNRSSSEKIMKNIAVVYGANFGGKLIDEVLKPALPAEADLPVTLGLAIGLPVLAKFAKLGDTPSTLLTVLGAYESTNLWDIAEQYMAPPAARAAQAVAKVQASKVALQQTTTVLPSATTRYAVTG